MSKQLYQEALADVRQLQEVAEDNAKRAILEAVTPRIRDLIETQLLGDTSQDEIGDPDKLLMDDPLETSDAFEAPVSDVEVSPVVDDTMPMDAEAPVDPVANAGDSDASAEAISMPDADGKVTLDLDALKVPGSEDQYEIGPDAIHAMESLVSTSKGNILKTEVVELGRKVEKLAAAGKLIRESKGYFDVVSSTVSEIENTYAKLQQVAASPFRTKLEEILEKHYATLMQLTEQKMKKNRLSEADVTLKLTGLPDDVDLDSVGVDLITGEEGEEGAEGGDLDLEPGDEGAEEGGDELDLDLDGDEGDEGASDDEESTDQMESRRLADDVIVEIDEGMLRREISRMRALREADEGTKPQSWGHGPGDVSDEFADEDMGDPVTDVELTTEGDYGTEEEGTLEMVEADGMDQAEDPRDVGGDVADAGPGAESGKESRSPGQTVEALRRRLAAEARLQTEAKKKAMKAKKAQKMTEKQMKDAKSQVDKQNKKLQTKKLQEAYVFYARRYNESVARCKKFRSMLSEAMNKGPALNGTSNRSAAETSNLRAKLAETNLFNAKLLFTNKLLQNESLTKRQKAEVIERLDEAKTEREVKLVYESTTKALAGSGPSRLSETTSPRAVIGSASRPARPASTKLDEGFEVNRWARLAGIK